MVKFDEKHTPVLYEELVTNIKIFNNKQNIVVDCTLWMAGHAMWIIDKMNDWDIFIWFDADIKNLNLASEILKNNVKKNVKIHLINSNYVNLKQELEKIGIEKVTGIYYDLWLSSLHVDDAERWFSFKKDWPLDMRFDKTTWKTAYDVVNFLLKDDLVKIFREYWEEPMANKIAISIVEKRKLRKFETTTNLADLIWSISKFPKSKNRIFQAIRIEVNNELKNLEVSINDAIDILEKDWYIFAISFHSLEDRIIKHIFKKESKNCYCDDIICSCKHLARIKQINKKPILPTQEEQAQNSRSRSAKARFVKKI